MHDPKLIALAERLQELRDEKRYLEGEIERVSAELGEALEAGFKGALGDVTVRVTAPRPGLRITSAEDVPRDLCSIQPDRKEILRRIAETGEVPPGVEPTTGRPTIYTSPSKV